ncbi:long-chain fatty acid--CoA ligase, partial [Escherichia coli]|nr:long-chain fatty acid--CoA ligase [Escherichia coli]
AELLFPLRPERQWRRMHEAGVSVLDATPTQLRLMLAGEGPALPALRHVFCGGGKLDPECRADLARHAPDAQILEFYGATETSFITMADADTPQGSVGRPYPGVEMLIRDADAGGVGEIWLRSPYLFSGYATGSSADTRWDDRFLSIGEMGYLDAQGNLFLKGRKNRMVTVADHNVFPEDIEAVLTATSGRLSAAIPVPDAQRGHAIVAVIAGAADGALPPRLRQACSRALGPHAAPRRVLFADPFPLLPAGKPDLVALREFALGAA